MLKMLDIPKIAMLVRNWSIFYEKEERDFPTKLKKPNIASGGSVVYINTSDVDDQIQIHKKEKW